MTYLKVKFTNGTGISARKLANKLNLMNLTEQKYQEMNLAVIVANVGGRLMICAQMRAFMVY